MLGSLNGITALSHYQKHVSKGHYLSELDKETRMYDLAPTSGTMKNAIVVSTSSSADVLCNTDIFDGPGTNDAFFRKRTGGSFKASNTEESPVLLRKVAKVIVGLAALYKITRLLSICCICWIHLFLIFGLSKTFRTVCQTSRTFVRLAQGMRL